MCFSLLHSCTYYAHMFSVLNICQQCRKLWRLKKNACEGVSKLLTGSVFFPWMRLLTKPVHSSAPTQASLLLSRTHCGLTSLKVCRQAATSRGHSCHQVEGQGESVVFLHDNQQFNPLGSFRWGPSPEKSWSNTFLRFGGAIEVSLSGLLNVLQGDVTKIGVQV